MKTNYLDTVKSFYKKHKRLPSYSEMLRLFNFTSKNSIFRIVRKWMEEGVMKKEAGKLAPTSRFFSLPFLGIIKAGFPILAEEDKNYLTLDEYLIEDPQSSFLLRVSGDSLMNVGVFDGDLVIIERKRQAASGDIVLAQIDREWTLKILKKENQKIFLISANPKYPPFYPLQELQIHGVVKAVVRKFN